MGKSFDSLTGEPVNQENQGRSAGQPGTQNYDSMAGNPFGNQDYSAGQPGAQNYDSMAGNPFGNQGYSTGRPGGQNYDPVTGKPVRNRDRSAGSRGGQNYDPLPVKPFGYRFSSPGQPGAHNYDPMTGRPIGNRNRFTGQPGSQNYDPMTGRPIGDRNRFTGQPGARNSDPITGKPVGRGSGKGGFLKWLILIPVLLLGIVAAAAAGIKSGLFVGNPQKVLLAFYNTFNEKSAILEALEPLSVLSEDSCTVSLDIETEEALVSLDIAGKDGQKQIDGSVSVWGSDIDFAAALTSEEVQLQVPALDSRLFVYNYTDEKNGYICNILSRDEIEEIDRLCAVAASGKEQEKQTDELTEIIYDAYSNLEFASVSAAKYEIDGAERSCKGYATTITAADMMSLLDNLEDYAEEAYGGLLEEFGDYTVSEIFEELKDTFSEMPDMHATFYIYKNKLACIALEAEGETAEIVFRGGRDKGAEHRCSFGQRDGAGAGG
ncbi:MAG: hypothetical protein LUG62_03400 [Clostridiales bacterium]|nr:hypothetical protein [Clostridiales bacterium]